EGVLRGVFGGAGRAGLDAAAAQGTGRCDCGAGRGTRRMGLHEPDRAGRSDHFTLLPGAGRVALPAHRTMSKGGSMQWRPVTEHRFKLAEGPFWDGQEQALYWVDIAGRLACRLGAGQYRQWRFDEPVSSFIACVGGGALVTLASGVYRLDTASTEDSPRLELLCIPDKVPGNRANEARCDEHGRLWLGSMQNNLDADGGDLPITRRSGGLFRIDADGKVTQLLSDLGIANTLLWSAEGDCLLSADSLDGVIYRYAIKADGSLGECEIWAGVQVRGIPD